MAKIIEETVVITISKIARAQDAAHGVVSDDFLSAIEAMAAEVINDPAVIVEVVKATDLDD